jgi:uncharacterized protein
MPAEAGREKACSACGAAFACGPGTAEDGSGCWCQSLPPLAPLAGRDCLCPACLAAAVARQNAETPTRSNEGFMR